MSNKLYCALAIGAAALIAALSGCPKTPAATIVPTLVPCPGVVAPELADLPEKHENMTVMEVLHRQAKLEALYEECRAAHDKCVGSAKACREVMDEANGE